MKLKKIILLSVGLLISVLAIGQVDTTQVPTIEFPTGGNFFDWYVWAQNNFWAIFTSLFLFLEIVVRLTPTERDNNLLRRIQSWIDVIIPNRKKGAQGAKFAAFEYVEDTPVLARSEGKAKEGDDETCGNCVCDK